MMEQKNRSVFETLNSINVNEHTEKKNGLTYLSWAWAWAEIKKAYPAATYRIYEDANGMFYFTDGHTCWVKTGVTIEGIENIEYLPVMDFRNQSIPVDKVTSFDANKAIQRSLTKACARHGLGLYIYAGEDLPEQATDSANETKKPPVKAQKAPQKAEPTEEDKQRVELLAKITNYFLSKGKGNLEALAKHYKVDSPNALTNGMLQDYINSVTANGGNIN